jgi:hypothetical protein
MVPSCLWYTDPNKIIVYGYTGSPDDRNASSPSKTCQMVGKLGRFVSKADHCLRHWLHPSQQPYEPSQPSLSEPSEASRILIIESVEIDFVFLISVIVNLRGQNVKHTLVSPCTVVKLYSVPSCHTLLFSRACIGVLSRCVVDRVGPKEKSMSRVYMPSSRRSKPSVHDSRQAIVTSDEKRVLNNLTAYTTDAVNREPAML